MGTNIKSELNKYYRDFLSHVGSPKSALSWDSVLNEAKLTYIDPSLKACEQDLLLCCNYLSDSPSNLNADQLAETLECIDLLIHHDAALRNWLNKDIKSQGESLAYGIGKAASGELNWTSLFKQCLGRELDNCRFIEPSTGEQFSGGQFVKTIAFIDVPRDMNGSPQYFLTCTGKERYLLTTLKRSLQQATSSESEGLCLLKIPETWSAEDVLSFKAHHYGIPSFIIGQWISVKGFLSEKDNEELANNSVKYAVRPYAILVFSEDYRKLQLMFGFHLEEIIWKSKLDLVSPFPLENWPDAAIQRYNQMHQCILEANSFKKLIEGLDSFKESWQIDWISSPNAQNPNEAWQAEEINQATFFVLVLNLLARISLLEKSPNLRSMKATLSLTALEDNTLRDDEGNYLYLTLQRGGEQVLFDPQGKLPKGARISIANFDIRMPTSSNVELVSDEKNILKKHVPEKNIMKAASKLGFNPTSSLALVSVGRIEDIDKDIVAKFGDSVAAIIELEDRHRRTAKLPEPWQYNLRKVMEAVASNPNIRYLAIIGEREYCNKTITYLESLDHKDSVEKRLELPPQYFPPDLSEHFNKQIKGIKIFDVNSTKAPYIHGEIRQVIRDSYQDLRRKFHEMSCIIPSYSKPVDIFRISSRQGHGEPLLSANPIEAIGTTIAEVYPKVVEAVRCFGETKKASDKFGRFYRELLSFRIIIEDVSKGTVPLGFDADDLAQNFQEQWLEKGGLFHDRMTGTEGFIDPNTNQPVDQINEVAVPRIVNSIRYGIVSRSIVINVHHPARDRKSALGLNTIHFTLEKSADPSKWFLHGSYIWRTVDVLFGLPYNAYAATQFLNYIVDECNKQLESASYILSAGKVIIVALNLHLYEDAIDQEIARQIVEQATNNT